MKININWLIGRRLKTIDKHDYTWLILLDDESTITTESLWRLITDNGIKSSSEDHGQKFGLSASLDAIDVVKKTIGEEIIEQYTTNPKTGDLILHFANATELQFLADSSGYENWHIVHGDQEIICMGGGKLQEIDNKKCQI